MSNFPKAKVLVVDDEPHNLLAMRELLSGPDREIVSVESGKEALRRILKNDFAIILLDVRMPEMDGFETAVLIRKLRRSRETPIVFLTGAIEDESMLRGYEVGGVDYILKPVDPDILKSKVAVFVDLYGKKIRLRTQVMQQKTAGRELSKANETLEAQIRERTASLIVTNDRLREEVLPKSCRKRVAIEAGVPEIWYQYVGLDGKVIGLHQFGLSAPGAEVMKERGIDSQHVIEAAKSLR